MKDDKVYLYSILERIARIETYTEYSKDKFMTSGIVRDVVIRNLEIIGEATKRISKELKEHAHDISWKQMAGLRDVLIHDYRPHVPNRERNMIYFR